MWTQKYAATRHRFPASAYVILTAVQERSLGCARDDDTGKAGDTRKTCHCKPLGIAPYILAAKPPPSLLTPHSSLLIPHSSFEQRFHPLSRDSTPTGHPWIQQKRIPSSWEDPLSHWLFFHIRFFFKIRIGKPFVIDLIMKSRCFNQPCTLFLYIYFPQSYFSCADYPINELLSPQNPYFFLCDNPVFILFWCVLTDSTQMIQSWTIDVN